ncbi:transcriptional repressor LexA, partial [Corynebacterium heidelbergense]
AHILSSGVSPSYQEIKDHFGLASFNSVQNYLKQLTNKGYISNPQNLKRAIQVLHSASAVQDQLQSKTVSTKTGSPRTQLLQARGEILSLPLLGKVAAGQPIEAIKHDEFVDVPPSMVRNPSKSFALKVQGDSMIEDGIFDE